DGLHKVLYRPSVNTTQEDAMQTTTQAATEATAAPTYRPMVVVGPMHTVQRDCAHPGVGGPCWGQVEEYERRHMLRGRVAMPLCKGHLGATYRAPGAAEVAQ